MKSNAFFFSSMLCMVRISARCRVLTSQSKVVPRSYYYLPSSLIPTYRALQLIALCEIASLTCVAALPGDGGLLLRGRSRDEELHIGRSRFDARKQITRVARSLKPHSVS